MRTRKTVLWRMALHLWQSRAETCSFSSLLSSQNTVAAGKKKKKKSTYFETLVILPLSVCLRLVSWFCALKNVVSGFTSKALLHQAASNLEGVPCSYLQSCLNYLIQIPSLIYSTHSWPAALLWTLFGWPVLSHCFLMLPRLSSPICCLLFHT